MHITFFIGGLSGGGAERVTCNLANYLVNRGHKVEILTMADDKPSYTLSRSVYRKTLLKDNERKNFIYNSLLRLYRFYAYLRKTESDAIVVMLPITTIMLLRMKCFTKAKIIAAERNIPTIYSGKVQGQLKRLASKADGWVFQTESQKEWYADAHIKEDVVIPNAINPDFIKPAYNGKRRKVIVTSGRLTSQKNHALLIQAFAKIKPLFPDYRIVIYGEGEKRKELEDIARSLRIGDAVEMPGYSTNIAESIYDASLFVLSSDFEGMPNALMEAMALGLPCISTDCDGGGARFLIQNGTNGLLIPKGDINVLSEAMNRMLSDRAFAEQCGHEAHKICKLLAPKKIYGRWEAFIKEIAKEK